MSAIPETQTARPVQLRRELGLWDGLTFMLAITIGAGIFAVPGRVAGFFPSFWTIAIAWLAASAFALTGMLIYAELGTRLPHTGGEYVYVHRGFGSLPAFLYGWSMLLVIRTNPVAALSLVFAEYAESFVTLGQSGRLALASALVVILGLANYRGLRSGNRVQWVTTIVKAGGIAVFVLAASLVLRGVWPNLDSSHVPPQPHGPVGNVARAMLLIIFAFVGWDRVGYLAGEMKNPERELPKMILGGGVIATVLYLSMNAVCHAAFPIGTLSGSRVPAADVARLLWGPLGVTLLSLLVMFSTAGSINANIMASSRVYYRMAHDGLFLPVFGRMHSRFASPHVAIILHCGWGLVLLHASRTVETLVGSFVFAALIFYGASTVALFKFRRQGGDSPFRIPGYPWLPALFLAGIVVLTIATCVYNPKSAFANLALMGIGLPFYLLWRRRTVAVARRD